MVWGLYALCYTYSALWMPTKAVWISIKPFFTITFAIFLINLTVSHHYNIHKLSSNYFLILSLCKSEWYNLILRLFWVLQFHYLYIFKVYRFIEIFHLELLLLRTIRAFLYELLCILTQNFPPRLLRWECNLKLPLPSFLTL